MLYFFIPLGNLISSILFMLYFSYLYVFGDVWLNYSIVSYEVIILEYYADWWMGWAYCSMGRSLVQLVNGPHCWMGQNMSTHNWWDDTIVVKSYTWYRLVLMVAWQFEQKMSHYITPTNQQCINPILLQSWISSLSFKLIPLVTSLGSIVLTLSLCPPACSYISSARPPPCILNQDKEHIHCNLVPGDHQELGVTANC